MSSGTNRIAFVVATKDRPKDLRNLLASLAGQSIPPGQVVIVDASAVPVEGLVAEFPALNISYIRRLPASLTAQRNAGIAAADPAMPLVGFLDDDIVLENRAMEAMLRFWDWAAQDVGGAAFNWMNPPSRSRLGTWLKARGPGRWLRLYSQRPGVVMRSGWDTLMMAVPDTIYVDWLQGTAMVWRREVLKEFSFDEWFSGYSYLEDLDFSYRVGRRHRLAVVSDAHFHHYPSPAGRDSSYRFGKQEVRNRLYIVRKHRLSVPMCYLGIVARLTMTLAIALRSPTQGSWGRAMGNICALVESLLGSSEQRS